MMIQTAQYHNSLPRQKHQYKRKNDAKTSALVPQMKTRHRIRDALRNLNRKNRVSIKSYIMVQKGDRSITIWNSDLTTRKMLDCMRENNFKGIIKQMKTIDQRDYPAIVDFCKSLETAVGIMRFIADNHIQKMTFEDYQLVLFEIMQAAGALADNPKSTSRWRDLENGLNALLRRLESHAALTEMLEEHEEVEEELDKRISASLLKF